HDVIAAVVRDRHSDAGGPWRETSLSEVAPGTDEWSARFEVDTPGWHEFVIVAWIDRFRSWRRDVHIKVGAAQDVALEIAEGALLVREAAARAQGPDAVRLFERAEFLSGGGSTAERVDVALGDDLAGAMQRYPDRSRATSSPTFRVWVDRALARF